MGLASLETNYLDSLDGGYANDLMTMSSTLAPMNSQCLVAVLVPAYLEGKSVYRTIAGYARQLNIEGKAVLSPCLFEITVLVNSSDGGFCDNTLAEANRAKQDFPCININICSVVLPKDERTVARARKILADLTLLRAKQIQIASLYLQTTDADLQRVDCQLVAKLIDRIRKSPIGIAAGDVLYDPSIVDQIDILLIKTRAKALLKAALEADEFQPFNFPDGHPYYNRIIPMGSNSAIRSGLYARVGGYDSSLTCGEDLDLSGKVYQLRNECPGIVRVSGIVVNSVRRFVSSLINSDLPPSYSSFGAEQYEMEIRELDKSRILELLDPLKEINEDNKNKIEFYLGIFLRKCKESTPNSEIALIVFIDMMKALGFAYNDYNIDGEKVIILELKNIKAFLAQYRSERKYEKWCTAQDDLLQQVSR